MRHSFDQLVGAKNEAWQDFKADFRCGLQIDDKLELGWLFDRNRQ